MTVTEGAVRMNNLSLDRFPVDTVAWWRFNEGHGNYVSERTGRFRSTHGVPAGVGSWFHRPAERGSRRS